MPMPRVAVVGQHDVSHKQATMKTWYLQNLAAYYSGSRGFLKTQVASGIPDRDPTLRGVESYPETPM